MSGTVNGMSIIHIPHRPRRVIRVRSEWPQGGRKGYRGILGCGGCQRPGAFGGNEVLRVIGGHAGLVSCSDGAVSDGRCWG